MADRTETAMTILQRVEDVLRRRRRRVVPAEEATLTAMAEAPEATIGLSPRQRAELDAINHSPAATV